MNEFEGESNGCQCMLDGSTWYWQQPWFNTRCWSCPHTDCVHHPNHPCKDYQPEPNPCIPSTLWPDPPIYIPPLSIPYWRPYYWELPYTGNPMPLDRGYTTCKA